MKLGKRLDWKLKLIISILCGVVLVIGLLFGVTYWYFVDKLSVNNERIVHMTFQETEKNLKEMMGNAERQLNRFANNTLAWEFSNNDRMTDLKYAITIKKIIQNFDEMISTDSDDYGFAILSGDGRTAVSTAERKSRTGHTNVTGTLQALMEESKENYPYVSWVSNGEVDIPENSPLHMLVNRPVLLGMKALEESAEAKKDSYLLVALDEEDVQKSYESVVYNGSQAVLMNEQRKIISATGKEMLGTVYRPNEENQNIEYSLSYKGWALVNMIPKKNYLQEAHDLRNFGIGIAVLACFGVFVIALIWSRKYTRPIQKLMEQMESVGREQLDLPRPEKEGWPELDKLNEEFYSTVRKLKDYIRRLQDAEQEKAKEELLALQYQINPHFLYNSLNSIRWMAMMTNNTKVADSLVTLSKIIMPILRNPSFTWKLKDELEFLENYVEMMQLRYGNYMEYHLECPQELYEEVFPRFILQPVIENCFVHGSSSSQVRHIYLSIERSEGFFIVIRNSDAVMEEQKVDAVNQVLQEGGGTGDNIGLANISKRLRLLYGKKGRIWVESGREGVVVHICF